MDVCFCEMIMFFLRCSTHLATSNASDFIRARKPNLHLHELHPGVTLHAAGAWQSSRCHQALWLYGRAWSIRASIPISVDRIVVMVQDLEGAVQYLLYFKTNIWSWLRRRKETNKPNLLCPQVQIWYWHLLQLLLLNICDYNTVTYSILLWLLCYVSFTKNVWCDQAKWVWTR